MKTISLKSSAGVTLIELLIVVAMMGVVGMAMFSIYLGTSRSSSSTEEVIEVQQNLRIALDMLEKDIRMAGFLIPVGSLPILEAPETPLDANGDGDCEDAGEDCFIIQTASPYGIAARISTTVSVEAGIDDVTDKDFPLILSPMVDLFSEGSGTIYVRVISPADGASISGDASIAKISSVDRDVPKVVLNDLSEFEGEVINAGDILVRVPPPPPLPLIATHPGTITYFLQDDPDSSDTDLFILIRNNGVNNQVVANKLVNLEFSYILDDGSETSTPTLAEQATIRAVRVTLEGQTDISQSARFSGTKTRQTSGVVSLRNR